MTITTATATDPFPSEASAPHPPPQSHHVPSQLLCGHQLTHLPAVPFPVGVTP